MMKLGGIFRAKMWTLASLLHLWVFILLQGTTTLVHALSSSSATPTSSAPFNYAPHLKTKIASSVAKTERREKERSHSFSPRKICNGCNRPPVLCICDSLPPNLISTSTNVLVLQHPREFRRKSLSTVPLMPLVLEKCRIQVGYNFTPDQLPEVKRCLDEGKKPLLLFPGPDAISLDNCNDNDGVDDNVNKDKATGDGEVNTSINKSALENLQKDPQLLILIDGTWAEALRMIKQSPALVDICQEVQFTSENESIFGVLRKEPQKHCISTLEACAHAITLLEPGADCANEAKTWLEGSMRCMVETKLRVHQERNPEPRFTKPGAKTYERNKRRFQIKEELFQKEH